MTGFKGLTQIFEGSDRPKTGKRKAQASHADLLFEKERLKAELVSEITLVVLLHEVHQLFTKDFQKRNAGLGLTRPQWRILMTLERIGDGRTQTELADMTDIEKAPLGKILDRLEAGGWIMRKADAADRRARRVYATAKIDRFSRELADAAKGTFARTLQGVRKGELKELIAQLKKLKSNLGGAED